MLPLTAVAAEEEDDANEVRKGADSVVRDGASNGFAVAMDEEVGSADESVAIRPGEDAADEDVAGAGACGGSCDARRECSGLLGDERELAASSCVGAVCACSERCGAE